MHKTDPPSKDYTINPPPSSSQLRHNLLCHGIVHRVRRMQRIQPKVPVDRNATALVEVVPRRRSALIRTTILGRIPVQRRLRIAAGLVQDLREERIGVELKNRGIRIRQREIRRQPLEAEVEGRDVRALEFLGGRSQGKGAGRAVDGRHVDEEEVARADLVELVDEAGVGGEDGGVERGVALGVGVADVVDAEEEGEEGVGRGPVVGEVERDVVGEELVVDLLAKGLDDR